MPEIIVDPKFKEWLIANYGESGANRILAQYAQDISVGKSPGQNQYFSIWVQRGRPGAEDAPAPQTAPVGIAGQGTPQIGFGGVPDWMQGLPSTPPVGGAQPPATQPAGGSTTPDLVASQRENQELQNALLRAQIEQMLNPERQRTQTPEFQLRAMARQATEQRRSADAGLDKRVREGIISALQGEKERLMSSPFRNWIKISNVQERIKELQSPPVEGKSVAERIRGKEADVASTQAAARRAFEKFPQFEVGDPASGTPEETQAFADILRATADLGTLQRLRSGEIGAKEGSPGFQASAPPTPEWLAKIYPQLQVGQPIKQQEIAPLSGQQWARMPESARQGFLGFAEFSDAIPMDILSLMGQMRTATPSFPRRWKPVKQV